MQGQVRKALDDAKVIVFVVDGQAEITRIDEELRDELFRYGKPVVLAANKLDNDKLAMNRFEFCSLGMGDPLAISSTHSLGIDALMDAVCQHLPETPPGEGEEAEPEEEPHVTRVAVIGKPNVGKSSFVNAILNEERVIVDETPGTTRDAIDIDFHWKGREYVFVDTAGMRKKAGIKKAVEHYSVSRSLRTVREADVCLVMMDANEGITEQDKRILNYVFEQGTGILLVWTKWDLVEDKEQRLRELNDEMDLKAPFMHYAPQITISNLTRQRLFKTFDYIDRIAAETEKRIATAELNRLIEEVRASHTPPSKKGKYAKILYATQASVKPTTFVLFVNQKELMHFSYVRFVENQLRAKYGFEGVPIHIELREEKKRKKR
jgi:GTP-binding protein